MTEEELKEHRTLERAFLHSKERRNLYKKRIKAMQKIIDAQNEVIQRKDHYIKKCLEQIEKMKTHENCKYRNAGVMDFPIGKYPCSNCSNYDKWELAE